LAGLQKEAIKIQKNIDSAKRKIDKVNEAKRKDEEESIKIISYYEIQVRKYETLD
jgi:hypothetical protein